MSDYVKARQCIACGNVAAPQTCIGVCQDRKVEALEHEEALAQRDRVRRQATALEVLVRRLARTNLRKDRWGASYRATQEQARATLAAITRAA